MLLCVTFVSSSYVILYFETLWHRKMIKTQQLPQEEVERFLKESKSLKTTVLVVSAVIFCFLPAVCFPLLQILGMGFPKNSTDMYVAWIRTTVMLDALLNPLIYCWRQKEMRKFVFRSSAPAVHPVD